MIYKRASQLYLLCNHEKVKKIPAAIHIFRLTFPFPLESTGAYGYTPKAFIFSLHNKEGLTPFKSMVKKPHEAIYRGASYGPTFGPGWDIYIANNANSNINSHTDFGDQDAYTIPSAVKDRYTVLAGTHYFSPDEVEVFHLV